MKKLMKPAKQLGLSEALCGRPEGEPVALVWPTLGTMWGRPVAKPTKDSGGSGERGHWSFEGGGGESTEVSLVELTGTASSYASPPSVFLLDSP